MCDQLIDDPLTDWPRVQESNISNWDYPTCHIYSATCNLDYGMD